MPTLLPTVKVTRMEAETGFLVTCDHPYCRHFRVTRLYRVAADMLAATHRASHQTPDHEEE